MLMNRSGVVVSINYAWDCAPLPGRLWDTVNLPAFWDARAHLQATWDTYPVVEHCAVMGHCYGRNYYHFTYETIQELRLFDAYDVRNLVVAPGLVGRAFQKDLFERAGAGKILYGGNEVVRVVDPVVAQTYQSPTGVHWLRAVMGLETPPGKRRYYVRRTPEAFRKGNNISETPEFLALLARYGFETIDFGNGENSIAQQVAMMRDAGVILAAHGAGLSNLGYLTAPLTVIEVFGRDVLSSSFLQLSVCLGFDYHAVLCDESDEMQCMVVDPQRLSAILDSAG
jgi:capsular polysaccharide biosynthesis protein